MSANLIYCFCHPIQSSTKTKTLFSCKKIVACIVLIDIFRATIDGHIRADILGFWFLRNSSAEVEEPLLECVYQTLLNVTDITSNNTTVHSFIQSNTRYWHANTFIIGPTLITDFHTNILNFCTHFPKYFIHLYNWLNPGILIFW